MIYSRRCEYAIRALAYLAGRDEDGLVPLDDIAEAQEIPAPFARKICRDMVRLGLLRSARGPHGGYGLARPASEITLLEIRDAVDGSADLEGCAVGLDPCTDETPCSLHDSWMPLRERLKEYLEETTLEDVAHGREKKRRRMGADDAGKESQENEPIAAEGTDEA